MRYALMGARVFDGEHFHHGCAVVVDGKHIAGLMPERDLPEAIERRKLDGGILAPGFIDVQVNGGGGVLLNNQATVEGFRKVADAHRRHGTTGLLPTLITDDKNVFAKARVAAARACAEIPAVLGLHQEGPFFDPARRGAHNPQFICRPTAQDIEDLCSFGGGILMITLAPNMVEKEYIQRLVEGGLRVSLGHSNATHRQVACALHAGASAFTHVFNAMSQMSPREPGMVGAAFSFPDAYCGIIADGLHVAWPNILALFKAKGASRVMLVTDAMPPAAGGPDCFDLQGRKVTRVDGKLTLADGTLAGSDLTMEVAVRNCVKSIGCKLEDALRMASRTPAEFLGRRDLGIVAPGTLASLVHLDDELNVLQTWVEGA
jgi:N-acetylglucosamine-6-phosphate deacetylase